MIQSTESLSAMASTHRRGLELRWSNPTAPICRSAQGGAFMKTLALEESSSSPTAIDSDGVAKPCTGAHNDSSSCTEDSLSRTTICIETADLATSGGEGHNTQKSHTMMATLHTIVVPQTSPVQPLDASNSPAALPLELEVKCVDPYWPWSNSESGVERPFPIDTACSQSTQDLEISTASTAATTTQTPSSCPSLPSTPASRKPTTTVKEHGMDRSADERLQPQSSPRKSLPSPWRSGSAKAASGGPASRRSTVARGTIRRAKASSSPESATAEPTSAVGSTRAKAADKEGTPAHTVRIRSAAPQLKTAQRAAQRESRSRDSPTDLRSPPVGTIKGRGGSTEAAQGPWLHVSADSPKASSGSEKNNNVPDSPEKSIVRQSSVTGIDRLAPRVHDTAVARFEAAPIEKIGSIGSTPKKELLHSPALYRSPRSSKPKLEIVIPQLQSSATGNGQISPNVHRVEGNKPISAASISPSRIPKMALKVRRSTASSTFPPKGPTAATRWLSKYQSITSISSQDSVIASSPSNSSVAVKFSPVMLEDFSPLSKLDEGGEELSKDTVVGTVDDTSYEASPVSSDTAEMFAESGASCDALALTSEVSHLSASTSDLQSVNTVTKDESCEPSDSTGLFVKGIGGICPEEAQHDAVPSTSADLGISARFACNGSTSAVEAVVAVADECLPSCQKDSSAVFVARTTSQLPDGNTNLAKIRFIESKEPYASQTHGNANAKSETLHRNVHRGSTTSATQCASQDGTPAPSTHQPLIDSAIMYSTRKVDGLSPTSLDSAIISCGPMTQVDPPVASDPAMACNGVKVMDVVKSPNPSTLESRTASIWRQTSPIRARGPASESEVALSEHSYLSRTTARPSELRATAPCFVPHARTSLPAAWTDTDHCAIPNDTDAMSSPPSDPASETLVYSQPKNKAGRRKKNRNKNYGSASLMGHGYLNPAASTAYFGVYHGTNWTVPASPSRPPYGVTSCNGRVAKTPRFFKDGVFMTAFDERNSPNNRMPSFCKSSFSSAIDRTGSVWSPRLSTYRDLKHSGFQGDVRRAPHRLDSPLGAPESRARTGGAGAKPSGEATKRSSADAENVDPAFHKAADGATGGEDKNAGYAIEIEPCGTYEVEMASERIGGLCHDCWPSE